MYTNVTYIKSICFKDVSNQNNKIELGYGLGKSFEQNDHVT